MKDTNYTFAVASVRAQEPFLLSSEDVERLVSAKDYTEAAAFLADKGWDVPTDPSEDFSAALNKESEKAWEILQGLLPDKHELDFLILRNDFHNLKAALKSIFAQNAENIDDCLVKPCVSDTADVISAVQGRKFDELPLYERACASEVYELLTRTSDGQLADTVTDRYAMEAMLKTAKSTGNPDFVNLANLYIVTANLKTALRCARTGKNEQFAADALCECESLNMPELIKAAARSEDEVIGFIEKTVYASAAEAVAISSAAFEKWCDDLIMNAVEAARLSAFGAEPLAAYWIARDAEIKTARIILACKHIGLGREEIVGRVRRLYV